MTKVIKEIFSESIFKQSVPLFVSTLFVNAANLVFWLYMVRRLSPPDYGTLNSLVSLLTFFSLPIAVIQPVIIRYVSKFMAEGKISDVRILVFYFIKVVGVFLSCIVVVLIFFSRHVSSFLRLDGASSIYMVVAGLIFSSFTVVTIGTLTGLQKFNDIAVNNAVSALVKLICGFFFVAIGFGALGGLGGFVFSSLALFAFSCAQVFPYLKKMMVAAGSVVFLKTKEIHRYFLPVALTNICSFAFTNTDILLVKHFFSPLEAGNYSVAQTLGKIVLFIPGAVGIVMFPKVVDSHAKNGKTHLILKKSLIAVGFLCGAAAFVTLLFPSHILRILAGHSNHETVILVKYFVVSMGFFALVQILTLYHLSLHKMTYIYILTFAAALEAGAIWCFHGSLKQVLLILLILSAVLFYFGLFLSKERIKGERS